MEFRLLGPVEVRAGGVRVPLGGVRQRALLAVLLVHAGQVVSRDRLIDELWGERSPDSAGHRLETLVSRLRKTAGLGDVLVTRSGAYVLEVDPHSIDARRFEHLLELGRRANVEGVPERSAALLGEALGFWRGEALGDLAFWSFARLEAERLEELRLAAIEELIDARLMLGEHRALVSELETLTATHPLRERPRGQLMRALYRSGRQADALEVYRQTSGLLRDELGLEPSPELKHLQLQILEQSAELDASAALSEARKQKGAGDESPRRTGDKAGGELTHPAAGIERLGEQGVWIPRPPAASVRMRDSRLLGRTNELRRCVAAAERARAGELRTVLISGEPGIGKTRVAAELAGRLHAAGMRVLWGRCDPDLGMPYQPFVEILTQYVRFAPTHVLAQHRAQFGNIPLY